MCKLVLGKTTLIHRRLWPALIALAGTKRNRGLDRVHQQHQPAGEHRNVIETWPEWLPAAAHQKAAAWRRTRRPKSSGRSPRFYGSSPFVKRAA